MILVEMGLQTGKYGFKNPENNNKIHIFSLEFDFIR